MTPDVAVAVVPLVGLIVTVAVVDGARGPRTWRDWWRSLR